MFTSIQLTEHGELANWLDATASGNIFNLQSTLLVWCFISSARCRSCSPQISPPGLRSVYEHSASWISGFRVSLLWYPVPVLHSISVVALLLETFAVAEFPESRYSSVGYNHHFRRRQPTLPNIKSPATPQFMSNLLQPSSTRQGFKQVLYPLRHG